MSLDEAALIADVRDRLFAPSSPALTIGAELELIPVYEATRKPVPIFSAHGRDLVTALRDCAARSGWSETGESRAPCWNSADGSRISFEPGGQIEISSAPCSSCSSLIDGLQSIAREITAACGRYGIELLATGTDPFNDIAQVPLQLESDRYVRMTRYLAARGEFGVRMMRQTAALQISVEHGPRPLERWRLLNALAPYIIAIFANSSRYAGQDTGHASYRAHFWRELDATRTGLPYDGTDAPSRYAGFALDAGALRAEGGAGELHSFGSLLCDEALGYDDWLFHLSTLFPEIRPKEYFEIRSADVVAVADISAPLVFTAGLVYDERASIDALRLLGEPDESLLRKAGKAGLHDSAIFSRAAQLVELAIEGAARLPASYLTTAHRAHAAGWLRARAG